MATSDEKLTIHIFRLPQEIQDIIFGNAYGGSNLEEVVALRKDGTEYRYKIEPRPSRDETIEKWLVCKKWFVAAARAYAESRQIPAHYAQDSNAECDILFAGDSGVLLAFATNVKASLWDMALDEAPEESIGARFPRLRKLTVAVDRSYLGRAWRAQLDRAMKKESTRPLTDEEIRETDAYRRLSALKKSYDVQIVHPRHGELPSENLKATLQRLEQLIRDDIKLRRTTSPTEAATAISPPFRSIPLYMGSGVSVACILDCRRILQRCVLVAMATTLLAYTLANVAAWRWRTS